MLNESFRLAAGATSGTMGVVWTAHADDAVSFVYVNGRLEAEAFTPGRAERFIDRRPSRRPCPGRPVAFLPRRGGDGVRSRIAP